MIDETTTSAILAAWNMTVSYIASGHWVEFAGRQKEGLVFRRVKHDIEVISPGVIVELEVLFEGWEIDLVGSHAAEHVAVEGKFKLQGDGGVPDNRKAAFFDLYKLERYISSGRFSSGLFMWLTDEEAYLRNPTGDSAEFSTHQGRVYYPGTHLHAKRSRNVMPLPLVLSGRYDFSWQKIADSKWYALVLHVEPVSA